MSDDGGGGLTRRRFLEMVGIAGGSVAVYETMTALGLINRPEAWAGPPTLPAGVGGGKRVLILGAGIGGLTAAYELSRAGYRCEILEAQDRAGGRSLTARRGTVIHQEGHPDQTCEFDDGLYLNMGPGRLPYHHRRVLHYCRELGVALEIYVMETTANLFQTDDAFDGMAQVNRRVANDTRGYIAELLAKAVQKDTLDLPLHDGDRDALLDLLRVFGDLGMGKGPDGKDCDPLAYCGSTRSGCRLPLTVDTPCLPAPKLGFQQLLDSRFWNHRFYQPVDFEWQPTLFQPVGGMDQIVHGFTHKIGTLVDYNAVVQRIHLTDDGVEITYRDRTTGDELVKRADYCLSNIPLPVLQQIPANFDPEYDHAVKTARFADTCKVGWQANERFWESDAYEIYGGISWIDDVITQMWYPSDGYFGKKGTLTGAYNFDAAARELAGMDLKERLKSARAGAIKLHQEFASDAVVPERLGLSIAWKQVPFQLGGWADWKADSEEDRKAYQRLLGPDRRFHVIGDQVSTLPGWQEGAMMSAEHVMKQIAGMIPMTVPEMLHAPDTRRMVQGRF